MCAPYSSRAVANFFLRKRRLTQMKLHKLLYYAHGWHLGIKGVPLLDETLEAWRYGPVVPWIDREFWRFGTDPISRLATEFDPRAPDFFSAPEVDPSDEFVLDLLARVWKTYGHYSAAALSGLTHEPGSPWALTRERNPGVRFVGIPNDLIRSHFAERVRRDRNGE